MNIATLAELRQELSTWKGIGIAQTANPVPGYGNEHSEIVFVGEAPGKKEDEQGKPFVGQSGKLLDALLASIGLQREDVYITNTVKFRPPENRDPTPEEKAACLPFLQREIAIIRPKVIVPLGRHALRTFLTTESIADAHGKPHALPAWNGSETEMTIFPIYHPAAALHNPGLRQVLFDDFAALAAFLQSQ